MVLGLHSWVLTGMVEISGDVRRIGNQIRSSRKSALSKCGRSRSKGTDKCLAKGLALASGNIGNALEGGCTNSAKGRWPAFL